LTSLLVTLAPTADPVGKAVKFVLEVPTMLEGQHSRHQLILEREHQ